MIVKEITYFDKRGPQNTHAVAEAVKKRCEELGVSHVVVVSNTGGGCL